MENENVNKKVQAALQSLDQMKRATPRPFLFGRIEMRLNQERNFWTRLSWILAKPVVALSCILLVLLINGMVIFLSTRSESPVNQKAPELATADEYSQVSSDFYEFENLKP